MKIFYFLFVLFIGSVGIDINVSLSQDNATTTVANENGVTEDVKSLNPDQEPADGDVLNPFTWALENLGGPLLTAAIGGLAVWIFESIRLKSRLQAHFHSWAFNPKDNNRITTTMLLGIGGSGKTTLGKSILSDVNDTGEPITLTPHEMKGVTEINNVKYTLHILDSRGQDLGTLIRYFIEQQLTEKPIFRYGKVNSLVIVVDIIPPSDDDTGLAPENRKKIPFKNGNGKINKIIDDRIKEHIEAWNDNSLDAVFGMLTADYLRYVCLYINKVDRLENGSAENEEKIRELYNPLIEKIEKRCHIHIDDINSRRKYCSFEIFVGSAYSGNFVNAIQRDLRRFATPIAPEDEPKQSTPPNGD